MFDLETEIENWRSSFLSGKKLSEDIMDELESHLRDSYEDLCVSNPEEEAFARSVCFIGTYEGLVAEFKKSRSLSIWDSLILRVNHAFLVLWGIAGAYGCFLFWSREGDTLLSVHVLTVLFGYGVSLFLGVVGAYGIFRSIRRRQGMHVFQERYSRHCSRFFLIACVGSSIGMVLGMIWAHSQWGKYWGWDPKEVGCLAVVVVSLCCYFFHQQRTLSMARLGQMSLMLSAVTMIAWWGASGSVPESGLGMQFLYYGLLAVQLGIMAIPLLLPKGSPLVSQDG